MAIIQSVGHLILGHRGNSTTPTERAFNQLAEGPAYMGEAERSGTRMQQNIMLVSDSYAPLIGGATQAIQHLAEQLHSRGHKVTVVTAWQRDAPALEDDGGVTVYRVRDLLSRMRWLSSNPYRHTPPPFPDPEATWRIRSIITRLQPDVVYSYGWISYSCAAAMLGLDIPLILSARDYGYVCALRTMVRYGAVCDGPGVTKCLRCASASYGAPKGIAATAGVLGGSRLLRRKISALQSCSGYVDDVMKRHLLKETRQPLGSVLIDEVIPDFHEPFEGQEPDAAILAQLPSDPFILFVGALRRVKGLPELFEAYQRMAQRPPLVLMGTRASESLQIPAGPQVFYDVPHATVMAAWERALFPSPSVHLARGAWQCGA